MLMTPRIVNDTLRVAPQYAHPENALDLTRALGFVSNSLIPVARACWVRTGPLWPRTS
jgi:hypothetical protein